MYEERIKEQTERNKILGCSYYLVIKDQMIIGYILLL